MDELKLCPVPWCERVNKPEFYNPEPKAYCVACPDCGLETNVFATEAEAIAAWNTRAEASSAEPVADLTGYERGQRETAERIVAWLWKCQKAKLNHHAEVCHREDDDVLDAIVTAMNTFAYAADAIEAGEWK